MFNLFETGDFRIHADLSRLENKSAWIRKSMDAFVPERRHSCHTDGGIRACLWIGFYYSESESDEKILFPELMNNRCPYSLSLSSSIFCTNVGA